MNKKMREFILETLKPFKFWIMGQLTVGIIWAIDLSLRPYILKLIIDKLPHLKKEEVVTALSEPVLFYLAMSLLLVIVFRFYDFVWLKLNSPLKSHVGDTLMKRMMAHSITMFHNHFAGNLANKIKDVMSGVPDLLKVTINQFFSHSLALIVAILTVWTINYKFSLLLSAWVAVFIAGSAFFSRHAKKLCAEAAEIRSGLVGHMVDILGNIASVHLFSATKAESKTLKVHLDRYVTVDQKRDWWFLKMFAFQGLSFITYQAVSFLLLIYDFRNGIVTPGDFALTISVNIAIVNCLWSLSIDMLEFSELIANITQGLRIALAPLDIQDNPRAMELQVKQGEIVFNAVKFQYQGSKPLFQNKSVTIRVGEKVGLVGYSGSGKSTFVNLILRLYDVTEGQILIDGQDIREVTQDSLHHNIAMIPQDPALFHRSLLENIRYGRENATDEEVIEAAKRAHAHQFILKLPQGYDSLVGERGVKLSGGQRQRIAIARAILKNAPILILDEATSQLDSVTESHIQETLWELMQGKTTIVIAHRLSTLLHMDRVLVFDKGDIIQDGSHNHLLRTEGLYKTLWGAQVGGFLPDKKGEG
jgi:ATP-binding cassette subfamily B protein